jgi:hypothetical protein
MSNSYNNDEGMVYYSDAKAKAKAATNRKTYGSSRAMRQP